MESRNVLMMGVDSFNGNWVPVLADHTSQGLFVWISGYTVSGDDSFDAMAPYGSGVERTIAENYGWNGTGYDRLQVDNSKNLKVAQPSGDLLNQSRYVVSGSNLAANANRKYLLIQNKSATDDLLIGFNIDVSNPALQPQAIILKADPSGAGGVYESGNFCYTGNVYLGTVSGNMDAVVIYAV